MFAAIGDFDEYGFYGDTQGSDLFLSVDVHNKRFDLSSSNQDTVFTSASGLDNEGVFESIMEQCELISEHLMVHPLVAFMLLGTQNWNVHRLYENWSSMNKTMLSSIGIEFDNAKMDPSLRHPVVEEGAELSCGSCWEDVALEDAWCLSCGHVFCTECWKDRVINELPLAKHQITCQEEGCCCTIPPSNVKQLCGAQVYNNFLKFLTEQQVIADTLRNCPNPECSQPVDVLTASLCSVVKCSHCEHELCTECKEDSHAPASCNEKHRWETSTGDNIMRQRLFGPTCKTCPKCNVIIEKNGGCNHMKCFNCGHQFCWMCMGDWSLHKSNYHCSVYKPENDPFLKAPDNISLEFLGEYNDKFTTIRRSSNEIKNGRDKYISHITEEILKYDRGEPEEVSMIVEHFIKELYWAQENLRWSQVVMFCDRWEQVKDLPTNQQQNKKNPPMTPQQNIFEFNRKELEEHVNEAMEKLEKYMDNLLIPTVTEIAILTKRMNLTRKILLKQRDRHYN